MELFCFKHTLSVEEFKITNDTGGVEFCEATYTVEMYTPQSCDPNNSLSAVCSYVFMSTLLDTKH